MGNQRVLVFSIGAATGTQVRYVVSPDLAARILRGRGLFASNGPKSSNAMWFQISGERRRPAVLGQISLRA
jgi:hypothetical protein